MPLGEIGRLWPRQHHPLVRRHAASPAQIERIGRSACDQCRFCTELCPRYLIGHPIEPHQAMRALGFTGTKDPMIAGTLYCCECNLCTLFSCPEDLDPKNVCAQNKRRLAAEFSYRDVPQFAEARAMSEMALGLLSR